jgi:putative transcriptional regulator
MEKRLKNRLLLLVHEKERKEGRRVPQSEIAKAIGVTNHTIGNWIRNDVTKFEAHVIEGLCRYFDCEVGDLLYLEIVEDKS